MAKKRLNKKIAIVGSIFLTILILAAMLLLCAFNASAQTPTATATPGPTPTATPTICRAIIDGTAGSGLTLRESPNGPEIAILPDGTILTLLEDEPKEVNNFIWRKVRTVSREEGWVVEEFLKIGECG